MPDITITFDEATYGSICTLCLSLDMSPEQWLRETVTGLMVGISYTLSHAAEIEQTLGDEIRNLAEKTEKAIPFEHLKETAARRVDPSHE